MSRSITDPEVQVLAALSGTLRSDYDEEDLDWEGSPFAWIKRRPSRQVGTIGEKLIAGWCATRDLDVAKSPDSEADRLIEGIRTEIKFSTLWKNGSYKFQQLRDQNYVIAVCLGISPFDAHCWVLTKKMIMAQWGSPGGIQSQHGGRGGSDTAWLTVNPSKLQPWLLDCGGPLSVAMSRLRALLSELANN